MVGFCHQERPTGFRFCFSTFQVWQCTYSVFRVEQHLVKMGSYFIYLKTVLMAHLSPGIDWHSQEIWAQLEFHPTEVNFFFLLTGWLPKFFFFFLFLTFCNLKWICFSVNYPYHFQWALGGFKFSDSFFYEFPFRKMLF